MKKYFSQAQQRSAPFYKFNSIKMIQGLTIMPHDPNEPKNLDISPVFLRLPDAEHFQSSIPAEYKNFLGRVDSVEKVSEIFHTLTKNQIECLESSLSTQRLSWKNITEEILEDKHFCDKLTLFRNETTGSIDPTTNVLNYGIAKNFFSKIGLI